MTERARIDRCMAAGAGWFFGLALSGAIGVPFWRDQPYGDGFDLSLTAAISVWFLVGAMRQSWHVTIIRGLITVYEDDDG